jgi:hypothetical protein
MSNFFRCRFSAIPTASRGVHGETFAKVIAKVIFSAFFPLTDWMVDRSFELEHWLFDSVTSANLSPTIPIQGSASDLGVHARSSGSPKDYRGAHLRNS